MELHHLSLTPLSPLPLHVPLPHIHPTLHTLPYYPPASHKSTHPFICASYMLSNHQKEHDDNTVTAYEITVRTNIWNAHIQTSIFWTSRLHNGDSVVLCRTFSFPACSSGSSVLATARMKKAPIMDATGLTAEISLSAFLLETKVCLYVYNDCTSML